MPPQDDQTTTPPAGDQPVVPPMGQPVTPSTPADEPMGIPAPEIPAEPTEMPAPMGGEEPVPAAPTVDEQPAA